MYFTQLARRIFFSLGVVLVVFTLAFSMGPPAHGQSLVRVHDLRRHFGQKVAVQGRTGYIAESHEQPGLHVFTLRDDYNDQVFVRTHDKGYPTMGVTYRVTGWPTKDAGTLFLDADPGAITQVYHSPSGAVPTASSPGSTDFDPHHIILWLVPLLLLIGGQLWYYLHQPPEWGDLVIVTGPDKGKTTPLRRRRITLGRNVRGKWDIPLPPDDLTISKKQAQIIYNKGHVYYRDFSSNGSVIAGKKVENGTQVQVASGDPIQIGMRGTVISIRLRSDASQANRLGGLHPPNPNDKTIMGHDLNGDTPVWDRGASYGGTLGNHEPQPSKHPSEFRAGR